MSHLALTALLVLTATTAEPPTEPVLEDTSAAEIKLLLPKPRQGYYLAIGTRTAIININQEQAGNLGVLIGGGFNGRFGQMANEWIGFGLNFGFLGGSNDIWGGGGGYLSIDLTLVPLIYKHLAVRGGVGLGGFGLSRRDPELEREDDPEGVLSAIYNLGLSYDAFPFWNEGESSGGLAFSTFVEGVMIPGDDLLIAGVMVGVEITWWTGFAKERLDLSIEDAFKK